MKQTYIKFPNNEWGVVIVYDFNVEDEYEILQEQMQSFGMNIRNAQKALNILSNYNTGMAISNTTLKMSAIYISKTTSISQFWDTITHEIAHVCTAIIDTYNVNYDSEDAAYLAGFLMRQIVEKIAKPCW